MFEAPHIIPVSTIDLGDERYKLSDPCADITCLSLSVKEIGLINPVIVRSMDDKVVIIAGFNRVRACLHAGTDRILVREIDQKTGQELTNLNCLKISITDNAFQRNLTISELIRSVSRLSPYMGPDQISKESPSLFNTPLNLKIIKDFYAISNLPQTIYPLLNENRLSVKPAVQLAGMPLEHADAFLNFFGAIKVSSSKQLDILMLCHEIAAREKIDLTALLSCDDMTAILAQDNPDQGGKGDQIRSYLKQRRYPHILAAEKKINDRIKQLSLKNEIVITPPKDFEGILYEAAFKFDSFSEYSRRVNQLSQLSLNPLFKDLVP